MRIGKWKAALAALAIAAFATASAMAAPQQDWRGRHRDGGQERARNLGAARTVNRQAFTPRNTAGQVNIQRVQRQNWNRNWNRNNVVRYNYNRNWNRNNVVRYNYGGNWPNRRWSGNWYHYHHRDRDFASGLLVFSLGGLFWPSGVSYYGQPPYNSPCFNDFYGFYGYYHDGYCYREPGPY